MTSAKHNVTPLDTLTFPLHGSRLIEASAGTGKTFTIAGLYLRLLLGHGSSSTRHASPLTVDQILVVTFTEAATAELKDRIRSRIHSARLAFSRGESDDPVIAPLLIDIQDHQAASEILLQAERQIDEAAIFTIHGFCQRVLKQNAFESGSRFQNEFITDETRIKAQVVADYWRQHFYCLPIAIAAEIRRIWGAPNELLSDIGRYLTGYPVSLSHQAREQSLLELHQNNLARIDELKAAWRLAEPDLLKLISESDINKRSYSKKSLPIWLEGITAWATSETDNYDYPEKLEKFSQKTLNEKTSKGTAPVHPVFNQIDDFLANPIGFKAPIIAHAIQYCRTRLAELKLQRQWLSFDDLLSNLSIALDNDESQQLVKKIRELYPVAMIDEFQDTDPLQYSIFSRIYHQQDTLGLFMIGDPKQAIYAFRGADIFTYIKARHQVNSHFTLGTNWRSSAEMVQAVNQIFSGSSSPFIYDQDIPFLPVQPRPGADSSFWMIDGKKQPALTFWLNGDNETPISKGEYIESMASASANHIQTILMGSQRAQAHFHNGDQKKAIKASDIAVLVRTGSEAQKIKAALSERGIASVYLSNRESVFSSQVAQDIQRLLQGVLTSDNERALRACLASELFALSASELDSLNNDESIWDGIIHEFKGYRQVWSRRGVLPMLRNVISKRHIAERLLEEQNGERVLTDLMHIGELLQQASQDLESDYGLLRWLAQAIDDVQNGHGGGDDQIQRLESERNLVQIVTIHKSKGLEYELVFLPFVFAHRAAVEAKYYSPEHDRHILDISAHDASLQQADKERLAEDLRLLYVALTRSVYGTFVGAAPLKNGRSNKEPTGIHLGAMGYLLQDGKEGSVADLVEALRRHEQSFIAVSDLPLDHETPYIANEQEIQNLLSGSLSHEIDRHWRISSYSGLVKQGGHTFDDNLGTLQYLDVDSFGDEMQPENIELERSIFSFPKGARPGTFLHTLFEEIEFTLPAKSEENTNIIIELLESEQMEVEWLPILQNLVDTVLSTPLDGKNLRLNQIPAPQRLVEMEFLLPIKVLSAPSLNRIVHRHDMLSAKAGELGFQNTKGMLKGFIDLVFEYQGKYYVLDWKSNYLGDHVDHYQTSSIHSAMADHRYDFQYQIYALALHRFLATRIANYDYQQHFGGVFYLFLRGMDGSSERGIFSTKPSAELLNELDALIDGREIIQRQNNLGQTELF